VKIHIITIGSPKLEYAKIGFTDYTNRLSKQHTLRISHLHDKWANNADHIKSISADSYRVSLVIGNGTQLSSHQLASLLTTREQESKEVSFIIGGPDGLPPAVIEASDLKWSLSPLTFPHDLAMVMVAEALYRATTINTNYPYHH
jgi:23S rRNA (pseudouridine1915-N3)-methyltransferase